MIANRFEQAARDRAEVSAQLHSAYLPNLPTEIADRVFGLACEQVHAYGWGEVEGYYAELAPVVKAAYQAGRESVRSA